MPRRDTGISADPPEAGRARALTPLQRQAIEMWLQGAKDQEVARELDLDLARVRRWRSRNVRVKRAVRHPEEAEAGNVLRGIAAQLCGSFRNGEEEG